MSKEQHIAEMAFNYYAALSNSKHKVGHFISEASIACLCIMPPTVQTIGKHFFMMELVRKNLF